MSSLMKRVSSNYFFMARVPHYLGSYTTGYKKRKSKDFLFWVPSGILSLRSSDFVDDEPLWVHAPPDTKKGSLLTSFFGCPVGFEPTTFRTTI